jgi:hypothetical protein
MEKDEDAKARINPAARQDTPAEAREEEPPRTREEQVKAQQSTPLNPLDPGGIGS